MVLAPTNFHKYNQGNQDVNSYFYIFGKFISQHDQATSPTFLSASASQIATQSRLIDIQIKTHTDNEEARIANLSPSKLKDSVTRSLEILTPKRMLLRIKL